MTKGYNGTVLIEPLPFARPRFNKGRGFNDPKYTTYKKDLGNLIRQEVGFIEPLEGPLRLHLTFTRSTRRAVDIDNLIKAVMDTMQDVGMIENDSQIFSVCAFKGYNKGSPSVYFHIYQKEEL